MEDTTVTFETAKLAKEKGWNGDFIESNKILTSQSLLQKWLREFHNNHVSVYLEDCKWHWRVNFNDKEFWSSEKKYEEALEVGLQEALKLLKN